MPSTSTPQLCMRRLASALLLLCLSQLAFATPNDTVRETIEQVVTVLVDDNLDAAAKRARTTRVIGAKFDFEAMTARTLATAWANASDRERARLTELFKALLVQTYWRKMSGYRGERIEVTTTRLQGEELASVGTLIHTANATIPVEYKLARTGEKWLAYDVVIEQVSLVRHYRGSFLEIVHRDGLNGLIAHLERDTSADDK